MLITVANLKGGAGKTTTAMYLALAATADGKETVLIDADRQGSAIAWSTEAELLDDSLPFKVVSLATSQLASQIDSIVGDKNGVIDCGPGDGDIMSSAVEVSDFVVIPSNARPDDLRQTIKVANQCKQLEVPYSVLITRVRNSENSAATVKMTLKEENYEVFPLHITELVSIGHSFGMGKIAPDETYDRVYDFIVTKTKRPS